MQMFQWDYFHFSEKRNSWCVTGAVNRWTNQYILNTLMGKHTISVQKVARKGLDNQGWGKHLLVLLVILEDRLTVQD